MAVSNNEVRNELHAMLVRNGGVQHSAYNVIERRDECLEGWRLTVPYLRDLEGD